MHDPSLQQQYSPASTCFGCGPANELGLRIASHQGSHGELIAEWQPKQQHAAFERILNGGVIGTLLDCHANWTAAMHLMHDRGLERPPGCVTAEYSVRLRRPTPTDRPVHIRAWVVDTAGDRVTVDVHLLSDGRVTASGRGVFVAVGPDHPAYERW
jgi:acyl-coenzyme A thioesterase PaaI-like protein